MFIVKKISLAISMILISYVGNVPEDSRSFFVSWFIFLLLVVIDYVEAFNFKKIEKKKKSMVFYLCGIVVFSFFTLITLLGSFGLITIKKSFDMQAESDFIVMKGLFSLLKGNSWNIESFILIIASFVVVFFIGEYFTKPVLSFKQKHKIKYRSIGEEELTGDSN